MEVHFPEREFCITKIWKLTGLSDEQPVVQLCAKRSRAPGQFFNSHFFLPGTFIVFCLFLLFVPRRNFYKSHLFYQTVFFASDNSYFFEPGQSILVLTIFSCYQAGLYKSNNLPIILCTDDKGVFSCTLSGCLHETQDERKRLLASHETGECGRDSVESLFPLGVGEWVWGRGGVGSYHVCTIV